MLTWYAKRDLTCMTLTLQLRNAESVQLIGQIDCQVLSVVLSKKYRPCWLSAWDEKLPVTAGSRHRLCPKWLFVHQCRGRGHVYVGITWWSACVCCAHHLPVSAINTVALSIPCNWFLDLAQTSGIFMSSYCRHLLQEWQYNIWFAEQSLPYTSAGRLCASFSANATRSDKNQKGGCATSVTCIFWRQAYKKQLVFLPH